MRNVILTILHCSDCGEPLDIQYKEEQVTTVNISGTYQENKGGLCESDLFRTRISVAPCSPCMDKYIGPGKKLAEAIKVLTENL